MMDNFRNRIAALCLSLAVPFIAVANETTPTDTASELDLMGLTRPAVLAALGEPMGTLAFDNESVLIYSTVRLTLVEGVVTEVEIREDARKETPEERDQRISAKRAEIGERLLEERKYEPTLLKMSPAEQLRHWARFKQQFPETDVSPEMEKARERLEEDLEKDHIFVRDNRPVVEPHESVTDPFYRKRRDFDSPFDRDDVFVVVPHVFGKKRHYHRRPIHREPYIIEDLPDHEPMDEVFNTPDAVAPIVRPPDHGQGTLRLDEVGGRPDTIDHRHLKPKHRGDRSRRGNYHP